MRNILTSFRLIKSVTKQVDIEFIPELTVLSVPQKAADMYRPERPGKFSNISRVTNFRFKNEQKSEVKNFDLSKFIRTVSYGTS